MPRATAGASRGGHSRPGHPHRRPARRSGVGERNRGHAHATEPAPRHSVTLHDEVWTAELVIPVNALRFDPSRQAWGFNAERYVPRERQTLRWSGATLDARFADFRRAGLLEVPPFRQGLGLTVNLNTIAKRTTD